MLADHGVPARSGEVKAALDRLVNLRCILRHSQAGWEFAVKAFPRVLAETATLERSPYRAQGRVRKREVAIISVQAVTIKCLPLAFRPDYMKT